MSRTLGDALPDGWQAKFLAALGAGQTIAAASELCGVSVGHLYRVRVTDYNFREAWEQAKQVAKLVRAEKAWTANDGLVGDPQHRDHFNAVKLAIEKNDPDAAPRLEVTGEVVVSHEARLTLAHVAGLATRLGLGGSASGDVPAAREILAGPEVGEPPASTVPAPGQP